jgi:hypothetical protein
MTDDLVHTCADTFGEFVVVQRGWVAVAVDTCLMTNSVELICRYAGAYM